ncbi:MAG: type II toxin-antitoxin system HicB family antitoxin [Promethearchaeota archaeon]
MMDLLVTVEVDAEGTYYSYSNDLEGVYGQGETPNKAFLDFLRGLTCYLESIEKESKELSIENIQVNYNITPSTATA